MSASAESTLNGSLHRAKAKRIDLAVAERAEREATIAFMDEARASHWGWGGIGTALGISGNAARRYYERNRRKVRSV